MLTNRIKQRVNELSNKLIRLVPIYVQVRKSEKDRLKQKKELLALRGTDSIQGELKRFNDFHKSTRARYRIIRTEVKNTVRALEKHSVKLEEKQQKIINKLVYKAISA